jgi:hypothetical protein
LSALSAVGAAASGPVDAARVLAERDRILAAAEFNPAPDWRARVIEWVGDRLEALVAALPFPLRTLGVVLLLLALAAVVIGMLPGRRRGPAAPAARAQPSTTRPARFGRLQEQARQALASGQLAEGVRLAWLAALALLDQAGLSVARASRADWEHVAATRRTRPDLAGPLADLALEFQRSHYGHGALAAAQAQRCLGLLATLEKGLLG